MKQCTITVRDEVYCHITGLEQKDIEFLDGKFAKLIEGARYMPIVKMGLWDGKTRFFDAKTGKIYFRLLDELVPYLESWGYEIDLQDLRKPIKIITDRVDADYFKDREGMPYPVTLRDYQVNAVNACLDNGSGFILAATGSGKCLHGSTKIPVRFPMGADETISQTNTMFEILMSYWDIFTKLERSGCKFETNIPVDISRFRLSFQTPTGWEPVLAAIKKEDTLVTIDLLGHGVAGHELKCAAGHLLFDRNGKTIRADELTTGDYIEGKDGIMFRVMDITIGGWDTFYDISIDADHHSYYDNHGVLHHNTWMVATLADVLASNDMRSLVIVPSNDLVEQTVETFRAAQLDVGIYSGNTKDIYHMVVVGTWQALQNNPAIVREFDSIIVDEAHGAKAKVVGELINVHAGDIGYRWGFTGTMPKPEIDMMTLRGSIGEVLFSITARELMDRGFLAKLEIEPVELVESCEQFPDYASEKTYLGKSKNRLDLIADFVITKADEHGNTLVLVNSVQQGKNLQKLIRGSVFLYGNDDTDTRTEQYEAFEKNDGMIVIATYGIASTGISIDRIFCLCMVDAGKSFTRVIQSIGRSIRRGRDKDYSKAYDIYSSLKWSKKHLKERVKFYKEALYEVMKTIKIKI